MKAMVLNSYGESAEFKMTDLPEPSLEAGQVLVRIAATSVNTVDTMIRTLGQDGLALSPDLPAVLGMDFAGTVESVGEGVDGFDIGDEVFGCAGGLADLQGALAELMSVDARLIAHKPKRLSMREAAALPLVGITAWEGLHRAGVSRDQQVLVHGGAGGVGHVALQVAKYLGANVYATASGPKSLAAVENFGVTAIDYKSETVVDYVRKHTGGRGFDVVFDSVGGANMTNSFQAATLNGDVATTVSMLEIDLTEAHFKGLSLHVVFMLIPMLHDYKREMHGAILAKLADIADAGALQPLLDESHFNLSEVGKAYEHLAGGQAIGKVIVEL